eukprot:1194425-Prorocentrum_minimum.AAC.2
MAVWSPSHPESLGLGPRLRQRQRLRRVAVHQVAHVDADLAHGGGDGAREDQSRQRHAQIDLRRMQEPIRVFGRGRVWPRSTVSTRVLKIRPRGSLVKRRRPLGAALTPTTDCESSCTV